MTADEKAANAGYAFAAPRREEAELDQLQAKLQGLRHQVAAVLRDWDRLSVVNGKSLVVGVASDADFRPLPTEAEIATVVTEIAERNRRVEALKVETDQLSRAVPPRQL